jgi:hypothetical protein
LSIEKECHYLLSIPSVCRCGPHCSSRHILPTPTASQQPLDVLTQQHT